MSMHNTRVYLVVVAVCDAGAISSVHIVEVIKGLSGVHDPESAAQRAFAQVDWLRSGDYQLVGVMCPWEDGCSFYPRDDARGAEYGVQG